MFTKKQYEEFEKLVKPVIAFLQNAEDCDAEIRITAYDAMVLMPHMVYTDEEIEEDMNAVEELIKNRIANETIKPKKESSDDSIIKYPLKVKAIS